VSTMSAGLIRPDGAHPAKPIDRNFVPLLAGLPVTGVTGTGPGNHKSGSRYAVRSPDLFVTEPVSLVCHLDWPSARYLGDQANPVLQAQLGLYAVEDDRYLGTFRAGNHLVLTDVPTAQSGGGSLVGRVKVEAGAYYVAGSFFGRGGAGPAMYVVAVDDEIFLEVRPVERADLTPGFYTRRTAHKLSVFDESTGALRASTVWAEDDAVTSVRADGTTVYVHTDAANAAVTLHASNRVESAGIRRTASTEQTYAEHGEASIKHGEINPTIKYGTPGVTY